MAMFKIQLGDLPELQAFLEERIYEYNAAVTGYRDAEVFSAIRAGESGEIEAGIYGYTWGGCCVVTHLWVSAHLRGRGLGAALLDEVERHARHRRCYIVFLSSHSFQAPDFYVRRGYTPLARVRDCPVGHSDIHYAKRLDAPWLETAVPKQATGMADCSCWIPSGK